MNSNISDCIEKDNEHQSVIFKNNQERIEYLDTYIVSKTDDRSSSCDTSNKNEIKYAQKFKSDKCKSNKSINFERYSE